MVFQLKYLVLLAGLAFLLAACSDDGDGTTEPTETGPKKIEFNKVFDVSGLPDEFVSIGISKAFVIEEDSYVVNSFTSIINIEDGNAEVVLRGVTDIARTSDGFIYGIGRDQNVTSWEALYYSTNGGNSFESISKPLMDAGVNTYQKYPDKILVRKLNDGTYLMILVRSYHSTSVGHTLHTDHYLESQDGINWEYRDMKDQTNSHFNPAAIDNEGNVFYVVFEQNEYYGTDLILYRSDDKGLTVKRVENVSTTKDSRVPSAVDYSGQLWSYNRTYADEDEYNLSKWNGSKWVDYKAYSGDQALKGSITDFTDENKIVYVTGEGIYIQK